MRKDGIKLIKEKLGDYIDSLKVGQYKDHIQFVSDYSLRFSVGFWHLLLYTGLRVHIQPVKMSVSECQEYVMILDIEGQMFFC